MWLRALIAVAMADLPWQCPTSVVGAPPVDQSVTTPKREGPAGRVTTAPPPPPARTAILLPEGVVVHALDGARPAFVRCFARARDLDPTLGKLKVSLHLDVDDTGRVTGALADADTRAATPRLAGCLAIVARGLQFPAPGQPAVVDVPLLD